MHAHILTNDILTHYQHRSRVDWSLSEKVHMPHTVDITRVIQAGGDVSQLDLAHNKGHVVIAPTLGVREGIYNPSVR